MEIFLEGIGLFGPGFEDWATGCAILRGDRSYEPCAIPLPASPLLPANERRRTVATVKLALHVGAEAFQQARRAPAETATVFTSSGGDGETIHAILEALATPERDVSPTRFHNSVHNAPSGYWSIATRSREPTTSLCAHDASFLAGLLDATAQAIVDRCPVALVAYDLPYPEPLNTYRPIHSMFGVAMVLNPSHSATAIAQLAIDRAPRGTPPTVVEDETLERLRRNNPAARSLPLLAALARRASEPVVLNDVFANAIRVSVSPLP